MSDKYHGEINIHQILETEIEALKEVIDEKSSVI